MPSKQLTCIANGHLLFKSNIVGKALVPFRQGRGFSPRLRAERVSIVFIRL